MWGIAAPHFKRNLLMQGAYGGLICILMYGTGEGAIEQEFAIITQDNLFILTDLSQDILATEEV